jgi:hypothetical protein
MKCVVIMFDAAIADSRIRTDVYPANTHTYYALIALYPQAPVHFERLVSSKSR